MEVIKSFLQGVLDIVTKYTKTVSDDVVPPVPKGPHFTGTVPSKADQSLRVGVFVLPTKRGYTITEVDVLCFPLYCCALCPPTTGYPSGNNGRLIRN